MQSRLLVLAPLVAATALVLAGCSGTAAGTATTTPGGSTLSVVASTNVYGQIVQEIGGSDVEVTSIIASASQDPHEYEASASDQLTIQNADLIVENGGGYDAFMDALVQASGSTAPVVVAAEYSAAWPDGAIAPSDTAATLEADPHAEEDHNHDHIEGFNEHVWYDPHTIEHVAEAIAQELGALDPANAATYTANAESFVSQVAGLEDSLAAIDASHAGAEAFVTEPVPVYLLEAAGLVNATPDAFSEAVEQGTDVPPATLLEAIGVLESGAVKLVIVNAQTGGAETTQVVQTADAQSIPVLEFTETLPDGQTYIQWMQQNIAQISGALGQ
jgi:zinc/manganese transport system substrate-binding protein